jgi:hypothetical protein
MAGVPSVFSTQYCCLHSDVAEFLLLLTPGLVSLRCWLLLCFGVMLQLAFLLLLGSCCC